MLSEVANDFEGTNAATIDGAGRPPFALVAPMAPDHRYAYIQDEQSGEIFSLLDRVASPGAQACIRNVELLSDSEVGAQGWPDLTFAEVSPSTARQSYHIKPPKDGGEDDNPGTEDQPWGSIAHAAKTLKQGEVAYIPSGDYYEVDIRTTNNGTDKEPIWLLANEGAKVTVFPPDSAEAGSPFIEVKNNYWIIGKFEINASGHVGYSLRLNNINHVAIYDVTAHDGKGHEAVNIASSQHIGIIGCHIYNYKSAEPANPDSHAIWVGPDSEYVVVRKCIAHDNDGDSFQCAGPGDDSIDPFDPPGNRPPSNLFLIENRFYGNREDPIDLKTCDRVTVRGNKLYRSATAIVIHRSPSRLLIENNRIWGCGAGAHLGAGSHGLDFGHLGAVVFRRNLVFNPIYASDHARGDGIVVDQIVDDKPRPVVEIYHNTFHNILGVAIRLTSDSPSRIRKAIIVNNIIVVASSDGTHHGYAIRTATNQVDSLISDNNVIWFDNTNANPEVFIRNNYGMTLSQWRSYGFDPCSKFADPRFVPDPQVNDYFTCNDSPARNAAIPTPVGRGCNDDSTPDIGFLQTCHEPQCP